MLEQALQKLVFGNNAAYSAQQCKNNNGDAELSDSSSVDPTSSECMLEQTKPADRPET